MSMLKVLRQIVQDVSTASDLNDVLYITVTRLRKSMQCAACSIYIYDDDSEQYVLQQTQGFKQEAVGVVGLAEGQGVVGLVAARAEPLNLADVTKHPAFFGLKEMGEMQYRSFLGVPILHQRKVLGVLTVLRYEQERFDESEEAFLVTLSAQLAAIIAHAYVTGNINLPSEAGGAKKRRHDLMYKGVAAAEGVAFGKVTVVVVEADLYSVPDKKAQNIDSELALFAEAIEAVKREIKKAAQTLFERLSSDERALFDVYLRMLDDSALPAEINAKIRTGIWAQAALRDVILSHVQAFMAMEDAYLRERASDVRDLGKRLLQYLQDDIKPEDVNYPDRTVVLADELTPAMLGLIPKEKLCGLISVSGSGNSHAAILSRSMGIPTVMGVVDIPYRQLDGSDVIVDGYSGRVFVNPSKEIVQSFAQIIEADLAVSNELETLKELPAITKDGYRMPLWVNTGLSADVPKALEVGAEGIGLYRTEIPFMIRDSFPSEQEQIDSYRTQLKAFAPRPVTMRTLDVGGDKALPYFPIEEENPSLGWRGIRITLDHPEIFLVQVRAMLRASQGFDNLRIMLPMVTSTHEVEEALQQIDRAVSELRDEGLAINKPMIGVMVEVPAAVYQTRRFAKMVDFISIGSNDLTQYLLAVDRNNPRVADLYAPYHPAVLKAINYVIDETHKERKQVSVCGEIAADPAGALLLMAMGCDMLSVSGNKLPAVKFAIRSVDYTRTRQMLLAIRSLNDAKAIQNELNDSLRAFGLERLLRPETGFIQQNHAE